jgi:hypothetical protein
MPDAREPELELAPLDLVAGLEHRPEPESAELGRRTCGQCDEPVTLLSRQANTHHRLTGACLSGDTTLPIRVDFGATQNIRQFLVGAIPSVGHAPRGDGRLADVGEEGEEGGFGEGEGVGVGVEDFHLEWGDDETVR